MSEVVIELENDAITPTTEQLQAAIPELFDSGALLAPIEATLLEARQRATDVVAELERIAAEVGWPLAAVAKLKLLVVTDIDSLTVALCPEAIQLDVQDVADLDLHALGAAWSRRTVTVKIGNCERALNAVVPIVGQLESVSAFFRAVEEERAEVQRIEVKVGETGAHLARLEAELVDLAAAEDKQFRSDAAVRRDRVRQQIDQAKEKLEHRQAQRDGRRRQLAGRLGTFLVERPTESVPVALVEDLRSALATTRSVTYETHNAALEARLAEEARARAVKRRAVIAVGTMAAVVAAVMVMWELRAIHAASEAELLPLKADVLQQPYLRRRMTPAEINEVREAADRPEFDAAYQRVVERLSDQHQDLAAILPAPNSNAGLVMVAAGPERVRLVRDTEELLARARELFGESATLRVAFADPRQHGDQELPAMVTLTELCSLGARIDYQVWVALPLGKSISISSGVVLDPREFCAGPMPTYERMDLETIRQRLDQAAR